jgi:DNA-binding PadR family transcriptional regulator
MPADKASASSIVLRILRDHPGGLLAVDIKRLSDGQLDPRLVSILLPELEGKMLVWKMHVAQTSGGPRASYRLTNKGREEAAGR